MPRDLSEREMAYLKRVVEAGQVLCFFGPGTARTWAFPQPGSQHVDWALLEDDDILQEFVRDGLLQCRDLQRSVGGWVCSPTDEARALVEAALVEAALVGAATEAAV